MERIYVGKSTYELLLRGKLHGHDSPWLNSGAHGLVDMLVFLIDAISTFNTVLTPCKPGVNFFSLTIRIPIFHRVSLAQIGQSNTDQLFGSPRLH
jgi:hypothetical protein